MNFHTTFLKTPALPRIGTVCVCVLPTTGKRQCVELIKMVISTGLLLVMLAVYFVSVESSGNVPLGLCRKTIGECELTPNVATCIENEGCLPVRGKHGNHFYPSNSEVCNNARKICASLVDQCLEMLWDPEAYRGYICTHLDGVGY
jgi:hypothetical protein